MHQNPTFSPSHLLKRRKTQSMALPKRFYLPRCLGLSMGFLAVFFSLSAPRHGRLVLGVLTSYCFLWPHLAYLLARSSARPIDTERRSMLVDAFTAGLFSAVMGFNPIPSVCILSMVTMNNMAMGGPRFMARGVIASSIESFRVRILLQGLFSFVCDRPRPLIFYKPACLDTIDSRKPDDFFETSAT